MAYDILNKRVIKEVETIKRKAEELGLTFSDKGNGHFQIKGQLLVNYYPFSKTRSAYVAGTTQKAKHVTHAQAFKMANEAPTLQGRKDKRSSNSKKIRAGIWHKKTKQCHWCDKPLTVENSTIEHIIPLNRGGLDHSMNRTLACPECNHSRGDNMPELSL